MTFHSSIIISRTEGRDNREQRHRPKPGAPALGPARLRSTSLKRSLPVRSPAGRQSAKDFEKMCSLGIKKAEGQIGRDRSHCPSALSHRLGGRSPASGSATRAPRKQGQKINITTFTIGPNILAQVMTDPTTDVTVSQVLMVSIDNHIILHVMERACWQ